MTTSNEGNNTKILFIAGFPRSGTTWFANLVNAHPSVIYRHEVIGRCFNSFPENLFNALKYENGLNDSDFETVVDAITASRIETDRPPFFEKEYLWIDSTKIHQLSWLMASAVPLFRPLYQFLYKPRSRQKIIAMKETRSSANMESMIRGLRTCKNVFLFRHPCGCIASSLSGIQSGKMAASTKDERKTSCRTILESEAFLSSGLMESDILSMPEYEYLAAMWRVQNENYINFGEQFSNSIFVSYETFMRSAVVNTKKLFSECSLHYDKNVEKFIESSSSTLESLSLLNRDSGSVYYSVYRKSGFNPDKWKQSLTSEQIKSIEELTLDTYNQLLTLDDTTC